MTDWLRKLGPKAYIQAQRFLNQAKRPNLPTPPPLVTPSGSPLSQLQPTRRQFLKGASSAAVHTLNPLSAPSALNALRNMLPPKEVAHLMSYEFSPIQRLLAAMETRAQTEDEMFLHRNEQDWDVGEFNEGPEDIDPFAFGLPGGAVAKADRFVKDMGWNPENVGFDNTPVELAKKAVAEGKDPRDVRAFIDMVEADRAKRHEIHGRIDKYDDNDYFDARGLSDYGYPRPQEYATSLTKGLEPVDYSEAKFGLIADPQLDNHMRMTIDEALELTPQELKANADAIHEGFVYEQWDDDFSIPLDQPGARSVSKQQELLRRLDKASPGMVNDNLLKGYDIKPFTAADLMGEGRPPDPHTVSLNTKTPAYVKKMAELRESAVEGESPEMEAYDSPSQWKSYYAQPKIAQQLTEFQNTYIADIESKIREAAVAIPEAARTGLNETLSDFLGATALNMGAKKLYQSFDSLASQVERNVKKEAKEVMGLLSLEHQPMIDDLINLRTEAQKEMVELEEMIQAPKELK